MMPIMEFMQTMGPEAWAILGITLIIIEVFAPSSFLLWPGLSALTVSVGMLLYPLAWQDQFIVFAVLSVVITLVGRRFYNPQHIISDQPELNIVSSRYIGHIYTLAEDSNNGRGRVKIGDSLWLAEIEGEKNLTAGTPVQVVAQRDTVLKVKELEP
ncbi:MULTISPECIES: NfeD family protein [Corallincola]|uniref:NfeD family protein n=3 Tax=Corallincola TaxID=1775176 RepID=A0A368NLM6_9GAMM|nr:MULTISPECIES: NfeD family protein [Corallincola]RCU51502.1 NfeD family protein [Corallincola holothuriorum]TAA47003.1 NfeD family protein [Corallincola spongiicola]TCI04659.1 NfeD family protein [Corallincola luteus]